MASFVKLFFISLALLGLSRTQEQQEQVPFNPSISNNPAPLPASIPSIPPLGFGTWNLDKSNASEAVSIALRTGYRHLDCAAIYGNEKEVGKGIKDGLESIGLDRSSVWITSKLWNDHHQVNQVEQALDKTLSDLGLEYLDLYLMHWPVTSSGGHNYIDYLDAWFGMEKALLTGKVRHIGVSNFSPSQLRRLIAEGNIRPDVHQFELHPYLQQLDFVQFHKDNGIDVTAYSPLANLNPTYGSPGESKDAPPSLLVNEDITEIAKERGCTNAQVALAWGMGRGHSVIPKSQHADRIKENYASANCKLEEEDYITIEKLGKKYLKRFNNPSDGWGVSLFEGLEDS